MVALDVPIPGVGPTLGAVVAEVEAGCVRIAEFARQADELVAAAAGSEAEGRLATAEKLLLEADAVYPEREGVRDALARVQGKQDAAPAAFDRFEGRLAAARRMFTAKRLGSCRALVPELDQLRQDCVPPEDAPWLGKWRSICQALATLNTELAAAADRDRDDPGNRSNYLGLRLARSAARGIGGLVQETASQRVKLQQNATPVPGAPAASAKGTVEPKPAPRGLPPDLVAVSGGEFARLALPVTHRWLLTTSHVFE